MLGPDGGTVTPQLVVLPADPAPAVLAAVWELAQAHPGRAVRCGLVGSAVGPGTGPDGNADAWAEVQVLLLDTGTQAQREAAAAGATAVVGALLTRVLAEPVGAAH